MQQRGINASMEMENDDKASPPPCRGRQNSKLKVLVRSHAMREEASPPREPSPSHLISPSIKVIPSSESSPTRMSPSGNPMLVLSPSISNAGSPCRSPVCVSPTSTLVASPNSRCSPQNAAMMMPLTAVETNEDVDEECSVSSSSPKYLNNNLNKQNLEKDYTKERERDVSTSHNNNNNHKKKSCCDCSNQNCIKCMKNQERNNNNNLTNVNNNVVQSSNTLTVNRVNSKSKLRQQSSSQGSFEGSSSNSPCLSRDSSSEQYTDTSGIDLELFIPETLNRNAKDRAFMLRIEQELVSLAKDRSRSHYKFPPMSSYQRMLVHRCAAYFGMDHNIESSGKCVVVNKTKNTRIPDVEFKAHIKEDVVFSEEPRRSILKRDSNSIEDYNFKSPDRQFNNMENRRSKSFEEREEEYEKVRRRIFNRGMHDGSTDDIEWVPWSSTDSENSSKFRLHPPDHNRRAGKLIKVLSEETGETLRPYVAKSYSFGGYGGVLNRGDSVVSTHSAGPRLLTKQDSGTSSMSWRLSPSSSGYKSQSQMSESVTPSPTSTPHPMGDSTRHDSMNETDKDSADSRIVWAVTDIQSVPKGSIIIDPQTGESLKNDDGSLYHYDPNHPPPGLVVATKPPPSPKKSPPKDRSVSPKKIRTNSKYSPTHKSHVNSSTSPSLPYSPPIQPNRGFQFISGMGENIPNIQPAQQQYQIYSQYAAPAGQETVPHMYQPPCIVYTAPYGVPVSPHYDGRIEPQIGELGGTYYISDNNGAQPPPAITYQQPPSTYWNQQPVFYQAPQTANQRYSAPMQNQNYVPSFQQSYAPPPQQPQNTAELVPVYPHQPVQVVYSAGPPPNQAANPVLYPNQGNIVYAQNPVYYPQAPNLPPYPQSTSTPNSCTSSVSHTFTGHVQEQNQQSVMQLAQTMSHMSFVQNQITPGSQPPQPPPLQQQPTQNYPMNKMTPPHFDIRQKTSTPKSGGKFNNNTQKGFILGSSQSSTGTSSPAATVVPGYCPQNPGMYRTPPETPPTQFNYGPPNFPMPQMLFRQMSNVRANTPGTARSSRSPTPASDISHFERQRMSLPPNVYHGMPYVLQSDNRIMTGRNQTNNYRHAQPMKQQSFNQTSDNRNHKTRKSKGNKMSGLPPNGKH